MPLALPSLFVTADQIQQVQKFFDGNSDGSLNGGFYGEEGDGHTNNWAVLVCASKFWFNYRVSSGFGLRGLREGEGGERGRSRKC